MKRQSKRQDRRVGVRARRKAAKDQRRKHELNMGVPNAHVAMLPTPAELMEQDGEGREARKARKIAAGNLVQGPGNQYFSMNVAARLGLMKAMLHKANRHQ